MTDRQTLLDFCRDTLQSDTFQDYAPNGLQIEGRGRIERIVTAVTASRAAIDYAAQCDAGLLLVHHGFFWKSEPAVITGWKKQRIATLLAHDINLAGYHLPLDAHPQLGNNARLAAECGWTLQRRFGEQNLLNSGTLPDSQNTAAKLAVELERILGRKPLVIGDTERPLRQIVWCSGGAQNYFQAAIDAGADVYLTGEVSEAQYHLARETGTVFVSAGHHATERYGVQALGALLAERFGIEHRFFDEANPV